MNELPPDPARLRVILAHLENQLADVETIATYLRFQQKAVKRALASTEHQATPRPSPSAPKPHPSAAKPSSPPSTGFVVEQRDQGDATKGAVIHTSDCSWSPRDARPVEVGLARDVLAKDGQFFTACTFCRPDNALEYFE